MYTIITLPGDGIGQEVIPAAIEVLDQAAGMQGLQITWKTRPCGAKYYLETGTSIDEETKTELKEADAIMLGAVGLPTVRRSDGSEVADEVVLDIRTDLNLFANVRPIKSCPGFNGPLNRQDINYTIVRENTEGLYASRLGGLVIDDSVAVDNMVITRSGVERVVRSAFQLAAASQGAPKDGVKRVTCVDKANTLKGFVFFRQVFREVAQEFPDIEADFEHADAVTVRMVLNPDTLNVLVAENMIGDIISDLGAATVGGMGLAPSANIGDRYAMFEPTHGSAPTIAGQGKANPVASILSGAMLLRWLGSGRNDPRATSSAAMIEAAVTKVMASGTLTPDLGGSATTEQVIARVIEALGELGD